MSEMNITCLIRCSLKFCLAGNRFKWMIRKEVTQEIQIPNLVSQVVTKSSNFSTEEQKTVVIYSGLTMLIFSLYFVPLKVCSFEGYDNKFWRVFNAFLCICVGVSLTHMRYHRPFFWIPCSQEVIECQKKSYLQSQPLGKAKKKWNQEVANLGRSCGCEISSPCCLIWCSYTCPCLFIFLFPSLPVVNLEPKGCQAAISCDNCEREAPVLWKLEVGVNAFFQRLNFPTQAY